MRSCRHDTRQAEPGFGRVLLAPGSARRPRHPVTRRPSGAMGSPVGEPQIQVGTGFAENFFSRLDRAVGPGHRIRRQPGSPEPRSREFSPFTRDITMNYLPELTHSALTTYVTNYSNFEQSRNRFRDAVMKGDMQSMRGHLSCMIDNLVALRESEALRIIFQAEGEKNGCSGSECGEHQESGGPS